MPSTESPKSPDLDLIAKVMEEVTASLSLTPETAKDSQIAAELQAFSREELESKPETVLDAVQRAYKLSEAPSQQVLITVKKTLAQETQGSPSSSKYKLKI